MPPESSENVETMFRYRSSQKDRTLIHPALPQPSQQDNDEDEEIEALNEQRPSRDHFSFVVCADTQIGMTSQNKEWETELSYSRQAIQKINQLNPKPLFVSICGDLCDMEFSFYSNSNKFTKDECDAIQLQQMLDFQQTWSRLDDSIALVCLCGNHDVGNRPTKASIDKYKSQFGDEYLAFWVNGTYNIVLNNVLFVNPEGAMDLYEEQLIWLENRLHYANSHSANHIFVFGHHPWFLYTEEEELKDPLLGSPYPTEWGGNSDQLFPDSYFSIPKATRQVAMKLFQKYGVTACFSGHFHQNLVSKSSFGMHMIITAPLSIVFESTGKPKEQNELEPNGRGIRIVKVYQDFFTHQFELLDT